MAKNKRKNNKRIIFSILCLVLLCEVAFAAYLFIRERNRDVLVVEESAEDIMNTTETKDMINIYPLFVGDSRTVGMAEAVPGIDEHSQNGSSIYYFKSLDKLIRNSGSDCLVIGFGVNDLGDIDEYVEYANLLGSELGKPVYFLTVNPVDEQVCRYNGYSIRNANIERFNSVLKENARDYSIIDTYNFLQEDGFETYDGLHYNHDTYVKIYDYIMETIVSDSKSKRKDTDYE